VQSHQHVATLHEEVGANLSPAKAVLKVNPVEHPSI